MCGKKGRGGSRGLRFVPPRVLALLALLAPFAAQAQVKLLEPIPGFIEQGANLGAYLTGAFRLGIAVATGAAVVMLTIAGFKYMLTGSVIEKNDAKDIIKDTFTGLAIAWGAFLFLQTVNPALVRFDFLQTIEEAVERAKEAAGRQPEEEPPTPPSADCRQCVLVEGLPLATAGVCKGNKCYLNRDLVVKLKEFDRRLSALGISWAITAAWPPTRTHQHPCHSDGTCIDMNFRGGTEANGFNIRRVVDTARDSGLLTACYEVESTGRRTELVNQGAPPESVTIPGEIRGEHFSVYGWNTRCSSS